MSVPSPAGGQINVNYNRDDFYGFADVAFHRHLGLEISRPSPEAPAVVAMPVSDELTFADGRQSDAAAYTVAEITSALAACDLLESNAPSIPEETVPLMLTTQATFRQRRPATGKLEAHARVEADGREVMRRLETVGKVKVPIDAEVLGEDGELVGEARFTFYFRLMQMSRLRAMTATAMGGS